MDTNLNDLLRKKSTKKKGKSKPKLSSVFSKYKRKSKVKPSHTKKKKY